MVNFLPYPKGNRDEWIGKNEIDRVSGAFVNSKSVLEKDAESLNRALNGLREYSQKFINPKDSKQKGK